MRRARETFARTLLTGDDRHADDRLGNFAVDVEHLCDFGGGFRLRCVRGVAFLP